MAVLLIASWSLYMVTQFLFNDEATAAEVIESLDISETPASSAKSESPGSLRVIYLILQVLNILN